MKKFLFLLIATITVTFSSEAKITQQTLITDTIKAEPGIQGQYQFLLSKSKTLNGYKLVNPVRLSTFWQSVRDTLAKSQTKLSLAKNKISLLEKDISEFKGQIKGAKSSLASSNSKLNEINFLGMSFSKSNYNFIVWSLIIVLGLALAFVIIRSAKHIHEAKYRSTLYEEIVQEYQNYKVKANDKEKRLARELQDERNKLEELKNK